MGKRDTEQFIQNHWPGELNLSFHLDDVIPYYEVRRRTVPLGIMVQTMGGLQATRPVLVALAPVEAPSTITLSVLDDKHVQC